MKRLYWRTDVGQKRSCWKEEEPQAGQQSSYRCGLEVRVQRGPVEGLEQAVVLMSVTRLETVRGFDGSSKRLQGSWGTLFRGWGGEGVFEDLPGMR
ncbi:hypothetical protein VZT92_016700 [Zoarces viviparus]|uniref:Uncharacterized protein n=1 Tax=Zoarces viviparus TaxID=48416 RepID=A0AAW1EV35_ZOAVI